jgi:hypothetical protein
MDMGSRDSAIREADREPERAIEKVLTAFKSF